MNETNETIALCTGAHTAHRLAYHFVWVPKRRRPILVGPVAAALEESLRAVAVRYNWALVSLAVKPDHLHVVVQTRPASSPAVVAQILKGSTSRALRLRFPALADLGSSLWQDGYYCSSVSPAGGARGLRRYLADQIAATTVSE